MPITAVPPFKFHSAPPARPAEAPPPAETRKPRSRLPVPVAPLPPLKRPVLVVAGGISRAKGLKYVTHYLTADGNNRLGGVFNADHPETLAQEYAKTDGVVFTLEYTHQFGTIDRNAVEMCKALDAIRQLTGHQDVDVVLECKAAIEGREALRRTGRKGLSTATCGTKTTWPRTCGLSL